MVTNYICNNCERKECCKYIKDVMKFSNELKTPIGIDIEVKTCRHFEIIEEDYQPDTI